jgi:hypothetical protein
MGIYASAVDDGFVQPTQILLDDLGPGCFVQKLESNGASYWVEITSTGDKSYECIAHPALTKGVSEEVISEGNLGTVGREQIIALGCERFCCC